MCQAHLVTLSTSHGVACVAEPAIEGEVPDDADSRFIVGRSGDQLCLLVAGEFESGSCADERDVTVSSPIEWPGSPITSVAVGSRPDCVAGPTVLDGDDDPVDGFSTIGTGEEDILMLPTADLATTLHFGDATTGATVLDVQLADGSTDFPEDACT
jgi:hypothetical protein